MGGRWQRAMIASWLAVVAAARGADPSPPSTERGDRLLAAYFAAETAQLRDACLTDIQTLDQWQARRNELRRQLQEMLGLDPWPERTPLEAVTTGVVERDDFQVERVQFQSRPGLYVTGNLYLPRHIEGRLPAILYVCGHSQVKKGDISYGNKTAYQHHGAWFARNGYVCLVIDSLQLGEIEGIHHGTYRYDMWWWFNRGYTPAGVEAWNCIRALDYLETRPEVDATRMGVTGRSGGGAYSWWVAALDDRIRVAVPVAGITDLENYVVDGCVEGHCDCMFFLNTYRWDYPLVAALVAPRPLLISNTDRDSIFPLDGVVRLYDKVAHIYDLYGARDKVALNITAGPHEDTQELRVHAFRWFNYYLKGGDKSLIDKTAVKFFEPQELRVFDALPADQKNTQIHETFVPAAEPVVPADGSMWQTQRDTWLHVLREKAFGGWPKIDSPPVLRPAFDVERDGLRLAAWDFDSQPGVPLRLYVAHRMGLQQPDLAVLNVLDQRSWTEFRATFRPALETELAPEPLPASDVAQWDQTRGMLQKFAWVMAYVAPRGIGATAWSTDPKKQVQNQRRFYLLGQTVDGMRVWDIRRAVQAVRQVDIVRQRPLWLQSERRMAGNALYASLFEPEIARLDLHDLPRTHRDGPYYLNVRRFLDLPQAVALALERSRVVLYQPDDKGWGFPEATARGLGWDAHKLQIRHPPEARGE